LKDTGKKLILNYSKNFAHLKFAKSAIMIQVQEGQNGPERKKKREKIPHFRELVVFIWRAGGFKAVL
jgi:hypothetical protein